ncbi:sortase [Collinsella ihumii]|uniref:sortase n=1 Tax=Collinsella ihumii TaxID=1720204 RepID=UPI0025AB28FD|nr:sortase [Collinsella ihumii]MDN0054717.1 sortase [Collinsella ihumii]
MTGSAGRIRFGRILMAVGALVVACAVALAARNVWIEGTAGDRAQEVLASLPAPQVEVDASLVDPDAAMPAVEVDGAPYIATLSIPAAGLELPVGDRATQSQLAVSPCRYDGSVYADDLVILGMDYGGHFGLLERIAGGEEVLVEDMLGNTFVYEAGGPESARGMSLSRLLEPAGQDEEGAGLVLASCDIDGSIGLVVRCRRVDVSSGS